MFTAPSLQNLLFTYIESERLYQDHRTIVSVVGDVFPIEDGRIVFSIDLVFFMRVFLVKACLSDIVAFFRRRCRPTDRRSK